MPRWQYQPFTEPIWIAPAPDLSWAPICPDRVPPNTPRACALLLVACAFVPIVAPPPPPVPPTVAEAGTWRVQCVDRIPRGLRAVASGSVQARATNLLTVPAPILGYVAVVFVWDVTAGADTYRLQLGSATGLWDVFNQDLGAVLSHTWVLPTGRTFYARVIPVVAGVPGIPNPEQTVTT